MAKLKPLSVGLSLGIFLPVVYTLRTLVFWLFPNFIVSLAQKLPYDMTFVQPATITPGAFVIGIVVLFIAGFVWGAIFAFVYNWIAGLKRFK